MWWTMAVLIILAVTHTVYNVSQDEYDVHRTFQTAIAEALTIITLMCIDLHWCNVLRLYAQKIPLPTPIEEQTESEAKEETSDIEEAKPTQRKKTIRKARDESESQTFPSRIKVSETPFSESPFGETPNSFPSPK